MPVTSLNNYDIAILREVFAAVVIKLF